MNTMRRSDQILVLPNVTVLVLGVGGVGAVATRWLGLLATGVLLVDFGVFLRIRIVCAMYRFNPDGSWLHRVGHAMSKRFPLKHLGRDRTVLIERPAVRGAARELA